MEYLNQDKLHTPELNYLSKKPSMKEYICHKLFLRDGNPFITRETTKRPSTRGYLIEFNNDEDAKVAYNIIGEVQSKKLYYWREITTVSGKKVNALIGRSPTKSRPQEIGVSFDGSKDPYFKEVIDLIDQEIKDKNFIVDIEDYFKV